MRASHRVAILACAGALAGAAVPAAGAMMHTSAASRPLTDTQVALKALNRLVAGGAVAGQKVDVRDLVRATVCFKGACVHRRLQPDPTCNPSSGVCLGTAERAWKGHHFLVEVELA